MANENCDVFLSFRGDVRNTFTCYLHKEFVTQGFQAFMDRENISMGDEIHERIEKAIRYSKSAIIVFSASYASSKHCLKELVHILERNRTSKYFVVPIFYYVEAAAVKHQLGEFGAAFEHVKERNTDEKIEEWRSALAEVGNILAIEITEKDRPTETRFITDIVTSFKHKFNELYPELVPTTRSCRIDIKEAAIVVSEKDVNANTSKDEGMACEIWMKDWINRNLKFVIIFVIVSIVLIVFIIVNKGQASILVGKSSEKGIYELIIK